MDVTTIFLLLGGLVLLVTGGESLVTGASRLARSWGISPVVIGLTVVAFGTSAPELAVSIQSVLANEVDIAVGNIVGSNIANVLMILGISALITPLVVAAQIVRIDVPLMIVFSLLVAILGWDGVINRWDGGIFFALLCGYLLLQVRLARRESKEIQSEFSAGLEEKKPSPSWVNLVRIVGGLVFLIFGSRLFVKGAVNIAEAFGLSQLLIGVTVVAIGTSLPEIVTSLMAALKKENDIAVGNVVGSNIFNLGAVLGISALTAPLGIPVAGEALLFDVPVMIAVSVACLPVFYQGYNIARWEGGVFFIYYIAYLAFLILNATQHPVMPLFQQAMLYFVLPLTVLTFLVIAYRSSSARPVP